MKPEELKIGYWPYSNDFKSPGDRRRFVFYAKEKKISFSVADFNYNYDIIYLTYGCNISEWLKYKKRNPNTKVIFELIDSYLFESTTLISVLRGFNRFITGKESSLFLNYKNALIKLVCISDAVVCSTIDQKKYLSRFNKNIHISLDYFSEDITTKKTEYEISGKLKIVWEGQAYTVKNLFLINQFFQKYKNEIELHIITDYSVKYPFKIFDKTIYVLLKKIACPWVFHNWRKDTFSEIIASCDIAIIPIVNREGMMWYKPENKLLLFWEIGIPVIATATPAYKRVMETAVINGLCHSNTEWVSKIINYRNMNSLERKNIANTAELFLNKEHSKGKNLERWDEIFNSVFQPAAKKYK